MLINILFSNDDVNFNITITTDFLQSYDLQFNLYKNFIYNDDDFFNFQQFNLNKFLFHHNLKIEIFEIIKDSEEYKDMIKDKKLFLNNIQSIIIINSNEYYKHSIKHYRTTNINNIDKKVKK